MCFGPRERNRKRAKSLNFAIIYGRGIKETAAGFARLERYRAALERTYHRSVRELRAAKKQIEPNPPEVLEKESQKLIKSLLEDPIPDSLSEQLDKLSRSQRFLNRQNKISG